MKELKASILILALSFALGAGAQRTVRLDIQRTVELATDSSLSANKYQSVYNQSWWEFKAYMASRKPQLSLESTPIEYDHYMVQRYLSDEDRDVYRQQRKLYSEASVQLTQDVEFLGGTLYGSAGVGYLKSFGEYNEQQFTTVPILVGYKQELLGFNPLKWNKVIEPMKWQAAEKEYAYNKEVAAEEAAQLFFDLAVAQAEREMAQDNLTSCDTLYSIGEKKFRIASISKAELLLLSLDKTNAQNSLINSRMAERRAMRQLAVFLNMDADTRLSLIIPKGSSLKINADEAVEYAMENNPAFLSDRMALVEAQRDLEKAKVENRFKASVDVRFGLNQVDDNLWYAFAHPLVQDYATVSLSIPLIDWGKGKYKQMAARSAVDLAAAQQRQNTTVLERTVRTAVDEFNEQQLLLANTEATQSVAEEAYQSTFKRFAGGKASVSDITIAQNRWQEARQNYINALKNYWLCYFNVRKLTLHDFEKGKTITHK